MIDLFFEKKLCIEHIDACPFFVPFTGRGFTTQYHKDVGCYTDILGYFKEGQADWITLIEDQQQSGAAIVEYANNHPDFFAQLYRQWKRNFDLIPSFYQEISRKDFSKYSDEELLKAYKDYTDFYVRKISFPGFIDAFLFYADKRLHNLVNEYCAANNIPNAVEVFTTLSAPIDKSFLALADEDLRDIAALAKKNDNNFNDRIAAHIAEYYYIKSNYSGFHEYTKDKVLSEINEVGDAPSNHAEKLKTELLNKYEFTPEIKLLAKLTELFTKWQDDRKIYTLTHVVMDEMFLRELERRVKIPLDLLKYFQAEEFADVLAGKLTKDQLAVRRSGCLFRYKDGHEELVASGKEAGEIFEKLSGSNVDIEKVKEIKGITASLGLVRGEAKVIKTYKDISKIQKGDILVASMTRPEHIAGMKLAGAIVTDDGGITCHAAIVSRELGLPCIIGTQIATKVLKDGDMVEVDANKGIVKIL